MGKRITLVFTFIILFLQAHAWGGGYYDLASWKTTPELNVEDKVLKFKKIDPSPDNRESQKVFFFADKMGLDLHYLQVMFECSTPTNSASSEMMAIFSQYGRLDFQTVSNAFSFKMGFSKLVSNGTWAALAASYGIDTQFNPCSSEFEGLYEKNKFENLVNNPIEKEGIIIQARRNTITIDLKNFFKR